MCRWTVRSRGLTEMSSHHCTTFRHPDREMSREISRLTASTMVRFFSLMRLHARTYPEKYQRRDAQQSPSLQVVFGPHFSVGLAPNFCDGAEGAFSEGSKCFIVRVNPVLRIEFSNRHRLSRRPPTEAGVDSFPKLEPRTFTRLAFSSSNYI